MKLTDMLSSGPSLKTDKRTQHGYPDSVIKGWQEAYRCIGVRERSAKDVAVKMNRTKREGVVDVRVSAILARLQAMERLGFVSQRKTWVIGSTKPVMLWKRVKPPCL